MLQKDKARAWQLIEDRILEKIQEYSGKEYRGAPVANGPKFFLEDLFAKEIPRLENSSKGKGHYYDVLFKRKQQFDQGTIDQERALRQITAIYLREVTGHLNPWMYKVISLLAPKLFSLVFVRKSIWRIIRNVFLRSNIKPFFRISGNFDKVKSISQYGSLIVTPTHSSNLDSPLLGLAFLRMGLPPLIYGAGINLFVHKFFAIFMNRLGAYRVDRLKKAELYKMVLKEYCTYTLETGYNNLFFPGGTRARSGAVESKLKTGLLSCSLEAYCNNVKLGHPEKKVFVVPCTINYHSVLEAPTLIEDFLKQEGQKRLIISDDESSRPNEIFYFVRSSSKFFLHIGDPIDPFGNKVNSLGESIDDQGNIIDIAKLAKEVHTADQNFAHTKRTAVVVMEDFRRHNIVLNPHVVAKVIYDEVRRQHPEQDILELTRMDRQKDTVDLSLLYDQTEKMVDRLRKMHQDKLIICDEDILTRNVTGTIQEGLEMLTRFHWPSAVRKRGDVLVISNFKLLLFYQNKLEGYW